MPTDKPPAIDMPAESFLAAGNLSSIGDIRPKAFVIGDLVTISLKDGSLTYGANYTPDAAAKMFWEAMSSEYRDYLKWKSEQKRLNDSAGC